MELVNFHQRNNNLTSSSVGHVFWDLLEWSSLSTSLSTALLGGSLACLQILQGGFSGGWSNTALFWSSLSDVFQRSSYNSSLNLVGTAGALFGCSLGKSLLMKTSPCLGPDKLGCLFSLDSQTVCLRRSEPDGLAVTTNHEFPISRINPVLRKSAKFSCATQRDQ